jgi:hypothetical protein
MRRKKCRTNVLQKPNTFSLKNAAAQDTLRQKSQTSHRQSTKQKIKCTSKNKLNSKTSK